MTPDTPIHQDLLTEIEAYCAAQSMSVTRFGIRAVGGPRFVHDLRQGRECRRRTLEVVRRFIASGPTPEAATAP